MYRTQFEKLDPRLFPAFLAVAAEGNFTAAADRSAMTQSGVSQHISKLEEQLSAPLFERRRTGAVLTEAGIKLQRFAMAYLENIQTLFDAVQGQSESPVGRVRYAMPESCLFADHFSNLLSTRSKMFPGIELQVQIMPMDQIYSAVREHEADFGFVAEQRLEPDLAYDFFCKEEYVLVAASIPKNLTPERLLGLDFVTYPGFNECFHLWYQKNFATSAPVSPHALKIRGQVDSLFGVMTMVRAGVGATVVARQCARPLYTDSDVQVFPAKERPQSCHDVFIVKPAAVSNRRAEVVIKAFLDM